MKLPQDATVAPAKISQYLLRYRDQDDKSQLLAQAGYTAEDATRLLNDIRNQLLPLDAELIGPSDYGNKYRICGVLRGPNGRELRVASIWITLEATGVTKFLTLYPDNK
ncbi:MAG: DUF6883 domain-containing protein [Chthoniobacteraceae bacterium]